MSDNSTFTRYMVYISFDRCDDIIRYSFVSHLSASLRRKGMIISSSFVDKSSKETTTNVKNFEVFVVVISEEYLVSAECLNELAEIVDCQQNKNTVVVPAFYEISPLEVVHRSDMLRDILPLGNYSADQVSRWKRALKKTTGSYKPRNQYGDCGPVEEISRDVYEKVFPRERIGIYSRLLEIENLLRNQSWGIRSIGIWGMPGIGKTTLAKAAFDQMSGDYEASCFIKDFDRAFRENGHYGLLKEHFGETLKGEFDTKSATAKSSQKRVLIVLDDVCKSLDAKSFLNGFDYLGPGSLIIISSRDKQVFVQCWINKIYEVKGLNEYEGKQLLSRCAYGKDWGKESDQETLTPLVLNHLKSVIEFASGNPLALSLFGNMLSHEKPKEMEMETEFLRLLKTPPCQIMKVFKSSYDTLNNNEKAMFLDIACFFRGEDADYVMQLFDGCGFFPHVGMYVLVEKCLVNISENKVQMHNLIQVIGREISNEDIVQFERHCRLWDVGTIQTVLEDEETKSSIGVEDIEAIFLEISNLNFFVKSTAFKNMHNLRLLKIYSSNPEKHQGLCFRKALESLPNALRLLHWEDYPLQSLPQDFDPMHLVELNMPHSQLQKLWGGTKTLEMLKTIRLCHSQQLVDIDDLLKAQNIEVIDLRGCIRFQRFIATGHLTTLRVINLSGCVEIKNIPDVPPNIEALYLSETGVREILISTQDQLHCRNCGELVNLQTEISRLSKALNFNHGDNDGCSSLVKVNSADQDSLRVLDLSGCSELKNIQGFPRSLKELYLSGTAIREVSSSICHLTALNLLDLTKCKRLQHMPMGMSNLTSLVKLMLSGCTELESIQDFPRNLIELHVAGTAIKELPSSLCDLTELVVLDAENCKKLQNLPIGMGNLNSLVMLKLSGCSELEDIHDLPRSLEILNLAATPIRKMPSSFEDLTALTALDLNHCRKLQHLRMGFFRSAVTVELSGCSELEYILGFSLQNMVLRHIDGTNKVMLDGPPPCKVILVWENWRRFQLLPSEMTGSKFMLTLMPFVTTPYQSKLPLSISSSLVSSMYALVSLYLSNSYLLDMHMPQEIYHFPSLKTLDLGGNGFRKLPESLKQLSKLKRLILCHCANLESLPELPQSLELLNAHSCVSLKSIHWSFEQFPRDYKFYNCFNLSPHLVTGFLEKGMASVAHMAREDDQNLIKSPVFSFSVPASVGLKSIFHLQQGSSVKIHLTPRIKTLLGFRVSVVVAFFDKSYHDAGFGIRCVCRWENKKGLSRRLERIFDCLTPEEVAPKVRKDHMFVFCDVSMHPGGAEGSDILDDLLVFEFLPVNGQNRLLDDCCMITKCGVDVISAATKIMIVDSTHPTTFGRNVQEPLLPRHRVFLSFGVDVRRNFISYLVKKMEIAGINVFMDTDTIVRGEKLNVHFRRIEESKIALVLFSRRYMESQWCLTELATIKECMDEEKLVAIPIFYKVSPAKLKELLDDACESHGNVHETHITKKWKVALKSVTSNMGLALNETSDEVSFIKEIVDNVLKTLSTIPCETVRTENPVTPCLGGEDPEMATLFGIEHRIKQVEEQFDFDHCKDTLIVGIVGMPGIGKTTLAMELFKKSKHLFVRCVAFMKIREKSKEFGDDRLRKMFLEDLLQKTSINIRDKTTHDYLEDILQSNKVFLVLDDVSSARQLEVLLGNRNWIKKGSRIVITTRDRGLISELDPNPYVVPTLNHRDGLKYFSFYAFEDHICNSEMGDYMKMSREFVGYAGGNPLALRVLGRELLGKGVDFWRARLDTSAKHPNKRIQDILRISYDELSEEEKDVFLDIACFFRSQDEYYVRSLLDSGDHESSEAASEITDLAYKFLINISGGRVEMHDLLHTFAMEICSKKRRLWKVNGIIAALHGKMETKTVRGISLDMSEVRNMPLESLVFAKMCNLRYLKFYSSTCPRECEGDCKLNFPDGLSLPLKEVRYLDWLKYPLEELPSDFNPKNLVDLRLPYSNIKQVWKVSKDAPKLKWVDLNNSRMLQTLSGFSKAPNLLRLNLEGCTSLDRLSEEMKTMESLVFLNLRGCTSLCHLPDMNLISLETLILSGCSELREFRLISENIESLYLDGTAIEDLPSDIVKLQRLILLNLKECRFLGSLPECIGKLKALQELILSGCSRLKSLPNFRENMENFRVLLLDGTSIAEVPKILRSINRLLFLRHLSLSRNNLISSLGSEISQLYHLKWLDLKYCMKLRSLSRLPPYLQFLDAHCCISLQTVTSPLAFLMPTEEIHTMFIFSNCGKLNEATKNDIASHIRRKCQMISNHHHDRSFVSRALIGTCYPGYEVPPWFSHQAYGSVLDTTLLLNWCDSEFLGIALCAIVSFNDYRNQNSLQAECTCEFDSLDASCSRFNVPVGGWITTGKEPRTIESDHVFIGYISLSNITKRQEEEFKRGCVPTRVSLRFLVKDGTGEEIAQCEVVKCGFGLVHEPNDKFTGVISSVAARTRMYGEVSTYISDISDEDDCVDVIETPSTAGSKDIKSFLDYFRRR